MKYTLITAILSVSLLTSCVTKEHKEENPPLRVHTSVISSTSINQSTSYSGVIEESSGTVLSFKVPGTITNLNIIEGQHVSKGQLIATLDGTTLQNNYDIAKSALATAQDTYNRMKQLHDANSIPEMKWVEVQNALASAKSACDIAKNTLEDSKLYAPFSGIISKKYTDAGSTAAPAVPIVKLVEISPIKASISVPENQIGDFENGCIANISVSFAENISTEGTLTEKGVSADPLSRTYTVKFTASNPDGKLLPGMLCDVSLKNSDNAEVLVIPIETLLLDHNNQSFVWIVKNGKAEKRNVVLGNYIAGGVVIENGLVAGEEVITSGQQKVSEGMSVISIK